MAQPSNEPDEQRRGKFTGFFKLVQRGCCVCHLILCKLCSTFKNIIGGTSMGKLLNIIPVSDLRQDAAKVLKQVKDSGEPVVITQRGRAAAVMLSVEVFEQSERDRELLRLLAKGEQEIEAGKGHDLDSVLAEADTVLGEDPS
jgi:prevent-host-death family protein